MSLPQAGDDPCGMTGQVLADSEQPKDQERTWCLPIPNNATMGEPKPEGWTVGDHPRGENTMFRPPEKSTIVDSLELEGAEQRTISQAG